MKSMLFRLFLVHFTLLSLSLISTGSAALITFDDLFDTHAGGGTLISDGYQGLNWTNFAVGNAVLETANNGLSGYYYGMLTASNVGLNAHGEPAEMRAIGTNFNFQSAYLTGAWRSNLSIEVQGFRGGSLRYDETVVASATNATLFTFNYLDIDRLTFNSFGGQIAGFQSGTGENFAMDNFSFEFVPEPSTVLLTIAGALLLWPLVKRK